MISCQKINKLMNAALDDMAGEEDIALLNAHLAVCAECEKQYADMKAIKGLLTQIPDVDVPNNLNDHLHIGFAERIKKRTFPWAKASALACGVLAVCLVGFLSVRAFTDFVPGIKKEAVTFDGVMEESAVEEETAEEEIFYADDELSFSEPRMMAVEGSGMEMGIAEAAETEESAACEAETEESEAEAPEEAAPAENEVVSAAENDPVEEFDEESVPAVAEEEEANQGNNKLAALLLICTAVLCIIVSLLIFRRSLHKTRRIKTEMLP